MNYKLTKIACYTMSASTSLVSIMSPLLFLTFSELYSISFTLLGFLVVINFCTQLAVDLVFSFLPRIFNIKRVIRAMPLIAFAGFVVYGTLPALFPKFAYFFLALGTVIFSAASGLCEVLTSPIIAAIPSEYPEKEMSKLHSAYGWGFGSVVIVATLLFRLLGKANWYLLPLIFSLFPLVAAIMFAFSPLPDLSLEGEKGKKGEGKGLFLFVLLIFIAGCTEQSMTQWISSYTENALGISKVLGDVVGTAGFAFLLASARTRNARKPKPISKVILLGLVVSSVCYLISALSMNSAVGFISAILVGWFSAMLWPGSLIYMGETLKGLGVTAYAFMAAGGDLGASVAPQLVGALADVVTVSRVGISLAERFGVTPEQLGMRAGLLSSAIFPLLGILLLISMKRYFGKKSN